MGHLADKDYIHALLPYGGSPSAGDRHGEPGGAGEAGGHPVQLESDGDDSDSPSCAPAHRNLGQIAQAGPEVQQRERAPRRHTPQSAMEPEPDRSSAPEPAVGPCDVA